MNVWASAFLLRIDHQDKWCPNELVAFMHRLAVVELWPFSTTENIGYHLAANLQHGGSSYPENTRQQTNFSIHVNKHFSSYNALGSTELLLSFVWQKLSQLRIVDQCRKFSRINFSKQCYSF